MRMAEDPDVLARNVPVQVYNKLPPFLKKLFCILNGTAGWPATPDIISWNAKGTSFFIHSIQRLEKEILGSWYKTLNYQSFARQLNIYTFSKVTHPQAGSISGGRGKDIPETWHAEYFCRDHPEQSLFIKRKIPSGKDSPDNNRKRKQNAKSRRNKNETKETSPQPFLPDNLLTIDSSAMRDDPDLLALTTQLAHPSSTQSVMIDPKSLIHTILSIQNQQKTLISQLSDLKSQNKLLWEETVASRERSKHQEEIIQKIIGVFQHYSKSNAFQWRNTAAPNDESSSGLHEQDPVEDILERLMTPRQSRLMIEGPPGDKNKEKSVPLEDASSPISSTSDRFTTLDTPMSENHHDFDPSPLAPNNNNPQNSSNNIPTTVPPRKNSSITLASHPPPMSPSNIDLTNLLNSLPPESLTALYSALLAPQQATPPAPPNTSELQSFRQQQQQQQQPPAAPAPASSSSSSFMPQMGTNSSTGAGPFGSAGGGTDEWDFNTFMQPSTSTNPPHDQSWLNQPQASGSNLTLQHLLSGSIPAGSSSFNGIGNGGGDAFGDFGSGMNTHLGDAAAAGVGGVGGIDDMDWQRDTEAMLHSLHASVNPPSDTTDPLLHDPISHNTFGSSGGGGGGGSMFPFGGGIDGDDSVDLNSIITFPGSPSPPPPPQTLPPTPQENDINTGKDTVPTPAEGKKRKSGKFEGDGAEDDNDAIQPISVNGLGNGNKRRRAG